MVGGGGVFDPDYLNLVGGGPVAAGGGFAEAFGQERRIGHAALVAVQTQTVGSHRRRPAVRRVGHPGGRQGGAAHGTICPTRVTTTSEPPAALTAGMTTGSCSRGTAALTA